MRIHYLQHVPFEGIASIGDWAGAKGHSVAATRLFADERLPEQSSYDLLIVMGGPMNIYEESLYPWLTLEKRFVAEAIESGKLALGICLGAQIIADVLAGPVRRNQYQEIGWFPVSLTSEASASPLANNLPAVFNAFHWHGDTFEIPPGATKIASSEGCTNQAFGFGDRVMGIQFHLESTLDSINLLIENCGDELKEGQYVQKSADFLRPDCCRGANLIMNCILNNFERAFGE